MIFLFIVLSCMLKTTAYTIYSRRTLARSKTFSGIRLLPPPTLCLEKTTTKNNMDIHPGELETNSFGERIYTITSSMQETLLKGSLIARVLPKAYEEFQWKKPPYPVDPHTLTFSRSQDEDAIQLSTEISPQYNRGNNIISNDDQDSDNMVEIDVFLNKDEQNMCHSMVDRPWTHVHIHMNRDANEMTERTLQRLQLSLARKIRQSYNTPGTQKVRGPKETIPSSSSSFILGQDHSQYLNDLASHKTNAEMWLYLWRERLYHSQLLISYSSCNLLAPNDKESIHPLLLRISSCPPTILSIKTFENFEGKIFTQVPIVIETDLIYATHAIITWFVNDREVLSNSNMFIPQADHVDGRVSVCIRPVRSDHDGKGLEEAYAFRERVTPLPYMPMVDKIRRQWIQQRRQSSNNFQDCLRVVTYNLLADLYASRESAQFVMFSHCNLEFLCRRRRFPMIVAELLAYDADIICLQEVDGSIFDSLLRPTLEAMGYQGYYSNKISVQKEGCAMFWSLRRFEYAEENQKNAYGIRDLFTCNDPNHWDMDSVNQLLEKYDDLRKVTLEKTGQILQVATMKPKCLHPFQHIPEQVIIANTHLFFHPMADHVRALQAYVVARKIDQVRRGSHCRAPFILCGDLNSDPLSGAAQLLLVRSVHPEHRDCWKNLKRYKWEMGESEYMLEHQYMGNMPDHTDLLYEDEAFQTAHGDFESMHGAYCMEEEVMPPTLRLPDDFPTVISGCSEMPIFTNYAVDFVETLDYILASKPDGDEFGFMSQSCAPMPTNDDIIGHVAMPNEFMPSDHVAVVCEFQWNTGSPSNKK